MSGTIFQLRAAPGMDDSSHGWFDAGRGHTDADPPAVSRDPPAGRRDEEAPGFKGLDDFGGKDAAPSLLAQCAAMVCCIATVSVVPPATKVVLSRHHLAMPPLTLAALQVLGAAAILTAAWLVLIIFGAATRRRAPACVRLADAAPVGALFGIKLASSNVGLALVSTETHVLLASTEVLWTAMFSKCTSRNESLGGGLGAAALVGCFVGSVLMGFGVATRGAGAASAPQSSGVVALAANLATPALQGIVVAMLRAGVSETLRRAREPDEDDDAAPRGSGYGGVRTREADAAPPPRCPDSPLWLLRTLVGFTTLKLWGSSAALLVAAALIERGKAADALRRATPDDARAIFLSVVLVAAVQMSFTTLASFVSAASIGVIGAVKVLPQLACAAAVTAATGAAYTPHPPSPALVSGGSLLVLSALVWWTLGLREGLRDR
ncbi:hypothetical protein M885DRAFT_590783 [Pelagophyceae sp. CCMP2097]|nr:hypothetical protein M885DRAFT_590783 [Pelagophyceae sp. CCMP2097]